MGIAHIGTQQAMHTVNAQSAFKKVCKETLHYQMYDVQITYMVSILKFYIAGVMYAIFL